MDKLKICDLAEYIIYNPGISFENLLNALNKLGLEFRKNKGISDINKALIKSRKNGFGKIELEQSMFEAYLADIVKDKRK